MRRAGRLNREREEASGTRRVGGSVLRRVRVAAGLRTPPGRQLERQLAVMVREGRLGPGRELPSTRRLADRVGVHRNTVAAAYRRLRTRGLVELRHGARARVSPCSGAASRRGLCPDRDAGPAPGSVVRVPAVPRLTVAAEEEGTARLMAAELGAGLRAGVSAETRAESPAEEREEPRDGCVLVALPGAGSGGPDVPDTAVPVRARQHCRTMLLPVLCEAPALAVVALLTRSRALAEAVRADAARLRGDAVTVRRVAPGDRDRGRAAGRGADVVIADRIAAGALLESALASEARSVLPVRLLERGTIAEVGRRLGVATRSPCWAPGRHLRDEGTGRSGARARPET